MSIVLVIKLGAMGDFVQAFGPFAAIRRHHAADHVVLLTTPSFAGLAEASGLFDSVRSDGRTESWFGTWRLVRRLADLKIARVYDLQTSHRSSLYFRLWPRPKPEWSGIAPGASHPHANPKRDFQHTIERQAEQLAMAGIAHVPPADLGFADCDPARFGLAGPQVARGAIGPQTRPFALMAPGGALHRPEKRWPVENFTAVAAQLRDRGITPAIVGHGAAEEDLARAITDRVPSAISLIGRTSLVELAGLGRHAALAVGNDTGPMHLAAVAGAPSVVLFGSDSDPALCAPRGPRVAILRECPLENLTVERVAQASDTFLP